MRKKNIQENKLNDVNSSKLLTFKPKSNHFYKYYKISNGKNNNKEIINSNKNLKANNENNDFKNEYNTNNNLKYIYKKEKQNININEINNQKYTLNIKPKKNYISSQTETSLNQNYPNKNIKENNLNNNEQKYLSKENINSNSTNEIQPKKSFKYLVHQASKSRDISNSFNRYYESRQLKSREQSIDSKVNDDILKSEENSISKYKYRNLLKSFTLKANDSNSSINSNNKEVKYSSLTDRKLDSNLNNMKIINFKYNIKQKENENEINNKNVMNNTGNKVMTQNIINNNIYNTTLNFYKINNIYKSKYIPKSKYMSANNIMENNDIIYEDESNINLNNINTQIKEEYINKQRKYDDNSIITNININLEHILELEKRIQFLLEKINKYQICQKECYEYIIYFFDNKLYNEEANIFKHNHTKKNFLDNLKIEILCFFLCYDITFSKSFNQTSILFKTIFNIIHTNFLIFASYLIYNNQIRINKFNQRLIENLKSIIDQDLKVKLSKKEMNDYDILQLITNNSKNINNYYKMVIDNIYGQYYLSSNNKIRFPQCLQNKNKSNLSEDELLNIKSSFFFDSYRLLTNYNFEDLYEFFNIFLNKKGNFIKKQKFEDNYIDNNNNINNRNSKRIKLNNVENKIEKYLLPKIKNNYKYSLVLDLDETLICIKRDSNDKIKLNKFNNLMTLILRPGLLDFLHKMKKLYELILFSLGTSEYVSPIIKNIEKKEKFFEHILYREHVTYDDNGNFFKNLNLLNRDVKNILIVDDNSNNFKYHKSNGICIKPFYGDLNDDKNTLKILGNILFKIRYDADLTGDIRISLNKEKNNFLFSQIANNY